MRHFCFGVYKRREVVFMLSDREHSKKEDMRVWKTHQALMTSMLSLLKSYKFAGLTVDRICKKGHVGRATFYAHFNDKYDFLKYWISTFWTCQISRDDTCKNIEKRVNRFFADKNNIVIVTNLFDSADEKTLEILFDFLCGVLGITNEKIICGKTNPEYVVASNFYAGGLISYLSWQVKNKFPPDLPVMNPYLYSLVKKIREWQPGM
jgi:hypothetical protein